MGSTANGCYEDRDCNSGPTSQSVDWPLWDPEIMRMSNLRKFTLSTDLWVTLYRLHNAHMAF